MMFGILHDVMINWLFALPICTGLGDRLGMIIALSALASMHNSSYVVHMEWCTQAERAVMSNPSFMKWIPGWTGYDFPLAAMRANLALPANIRLYESGGKPSKDFNIIREDGTKPAWGALAQTSTMFCNAIWMGNRTSPWATRDCDMAYKKAGSKVQAMIPVEQDLPYILIHFRGGDANTEACNEKPFCTRAVVRELHAAGVYMKVISNNHSFSLHWLKGLPSMHLVHSKSVYQDVALALSATAIVQHASTGWSSYTSVPAMARGIPLINTYTSTGENHRYAHFKHYGEVPREFHSCSNLTKFVEKAVTMWKSKVHGSI